MQRIRLEQHRCDAYIRRPCLPHLFRHVLQGKTRVDDVFEQDDRLDDLGIPELPFELDPVRFIEAFRAQQALRSNRLLVALPRTPGTIRLAGVEDDVLERHAQAYTASRADLLSS